jgi:hypothetical protein
MVFKFLSKWRIAAATGHEAASPNGQIVFLQFYFEAPANQSSHVRDRFDSGVSTFSNLYLHDKGNIVHNFHDDKTSKIPSNYYNTRSMSYTINLLNPTLNLLQIHRHLTIRSHQTIFTI